MSEKSLFIWRCENRRVVQSFCLPTECCIASSPHGNQRFCLETKRREKKRNQCRNYVITGSLHVRLLIDSLRRQCYDSSSLDSTHPVASSAEIIAISMVSFRLSCNSSTVVCFGKKTSLNTAKNDSISKTTSQLPVRACSLRIDLSRLH